MLDYPAQVETNNISLKTALQNPTVRENIEQKIQYHRDEIARLENVRGKMGHLLDLNIRDLREAMSF